MFSHSILELWPKSPLSSIVSISKVPLPVFLLQSYRPYTVYKLNSWHLEVGSCLRKLIFHLTHLPSLVYSCSSRVSDMDLLQFLMSIFVLLLSGREVTGTLKTTVDPSLKICISLGIGWDF